MVEKIKSQSDGDEGSYHKQTEQGVSEAEESAQEFDIFPHCSQPAILGSEGSGRTPWV